jgi:hypothetical protein
MKQTGQSMAQVMSNFFHEYGQLDNWHDSTRIGVIGVGM